MKEPYGRPQSYAAWTILVFGAIAFSLGVLGLASPDFFLLTMRMPPQDPGPFARTSAMAATNMGAYYVLAALSNTRRFFAWTVPFRVLTFTVFSSLALLGAAPPGLFGVAAWELLGAVSTGLALWYDGRVRG